MNDPASCLIKGLKEQMVNGKMVARPGIPKKANVRVEALPKRKMVWSGKVSRSLVLDLDPGRYVVSVSKFTDDNIANVKYSYDFYHLISEAQWKSLIHAKPKYSKVMNTTEGPRWRCQIPACDFEGTSVTSAVLHEGEHFGVDLLKDPSVEAKATVATGVAQLQHLTGQSPAMVRKAALETSQGRS